jgi:hypothetical protein
VCAAIAAPRTPARTFDKKGAAIEQSRELAAGEQ